MFGKGHDLEAGGSSEPLYPGMVESPDLRWALIHKIYVILSVQLAMTAAVAAFVVKVRGVSEFFVSSNAGFALYIFLLFLPLIGRVQFTLCSVFFLGLYQSNFLEFVP